MARELFVKQILPHLLTALTAFGVAFFSLQATKETSSAGLVETLYERVGVLERKVFSQNAEILQLQMQLASAEESEEILFSYIDSMPYPAWIKRVQGDADNPDFVMWHLNPEYSESFGVTLNKYKGKSDFDIWPNETAYSFYKNDIAVLNIMDSNCNYETFQVEALDPYSVTATRYVCKWVINYNGKLAIAGQIFIKPEGEK